MNENASGESLEIEVKFFLSDLGEFRDRLLTEGAILLIPRTYEHNIVFDNAWQGLAGQGKLLRVRQDAIARVTFKGSSRHQINSEVRVREEIEVGVDDFDRTVAILERIGFEKQQRYEKYRETYSFRDIEVVLDEMPFGDFVELEGAEVEIRTVADLLQLDWNKRIIDNYLALSARLKTHFKLTFDDITFDNFRRSDITGADVILEGQV